MISLDALSNLDRFTIVDSLRDAAESRATMAENKVEAGDSPLDEFVVSLQKESAYLEKLANDIENGLSAVSNGQAADIVEALESSHANCIELDLPEAAAEYLHALQAIG